MLTLEEYKALGKLSYTPRHSILMTDYVEVRINNDDDDHRVSFSVESKESPRLNDEGWHFKFLSVHDYGCLIQTLPTAYNLLFTEEVRFPDGNRGHTYYRMVYKIKES